MRYTTAELKQIEAEIKQINVGVGHFRRDLMLSLIEEVIEHRKEKKK